MDLTFRYHVTLPAVCGYCKHLWSLSPAGAVSRSVDVSWYRNNEFGRLNLGS
jgi:hypothetical protein